MLAELHRVWERVLSLETAARRRSGHSNGGAASILPCSRDGLGCEDFITN